MRKLPFSDDAMPPIFPVTFCLSQNHQKECQFAKVACPRQCGVVVARRALENHMALVCPKRKIICDNCSVEFTGDTYAVSYFVQLVAL